MAGLYTLQCTGRASRKVTIQVGLGEERANGVWAYVGLSSVEKKHCSIINPKKLKPVPIHAQTKPNPPDMYAFGSCIWLQDISPPSLVLIFIICILTPNLQTQHSQNVLAGIRVIGKVHFRV